MVATVSCQLSASPIVGTVHLATVLLTENVSWDRCCTWQAMIMTLVYERQRLHAEGEDMSTPGPFLGDDNRPLEIAHLNDNWYRVTRFGKSVASG